MPMWITLLTEIITKVLYQPPLSLDKVDWDVLDATAVGLQNPTHVIRGYIRDGDTSLTGFQERRRLN